MDTTRTKERPILFSGEMVRVILAGDKTQTRRVVKPQPTCFIPGAYFDAYNGGPQWNWWTQNNRLCNGDTIMKCPYGVPGERLWVRETWAVHEGADKFAPRMLHPGWASGDVWFRADDRAPLVSIRDRGKWRPSRYMPRWASRITLEVTGVRVERVQDISEADAKSEGCAQRRVDRSPGGLTAIEEFAALWESINAKRGFCWDVNPWVWVVEFRRLQTTEGA
ncbi:MAG: hypothetical protein V3U60_16045 [Gammaproteobacteria bacterium]